MLHCMPKLVLRTPVTEVNLRVCVWWKLAVTCNAEAPCSWSWSFVWCLAERWSLRSVPHGGPSWLGQTLCLFTYMRLQCEVKAFSLAYAVWRLQGKRYWTPLCASSLAPDSTSTSLRYFMTCCTGCPSLSALSTRLHMTNSCVRGTSPAYSHGICRSVASVKGRAMLRSANFGQLVRPRTRGKCYGPCSFRVAPPSVCNSLPRHLRNDDISREQFTRDLKTFLFAQAYSSEAPLRTSVWKCTLQMDLLTYLLTYL